MQNKKLCLIIGKGKTGQSAYNFLTKKGYMPLFYDDKEECNKEEILKNFKNFLFVVPSPGVNECHFLLKQARKEGIDVLCATELGFILNNSKEYIIGITGTNGKTTVTSMIGTLLGDNEAFVCGNIGTPWLDNNDSKKYTVMELSSFELARIIKFTPNMFILLNLAPDHIDYHGSFNSYKNAKFNPLLNMNKNDIVIYNHDDSEINARMKNYTYSKYYFSLTKQEGQGVYFDSKTGNIIFDNGKTKQVIFKLDKPNNVLQHNIYNYLAASLAGFLLGKTPNDIQTNLINYTFQPYRCERVVANLPFIIINDSKSTNLASVIAALKSTTAPITLLMGGRGKNEKYDDLFKFKKIFHKLVFYGEAGEELKMCAENNGFFNFIQIKNFKEAAILALKHTLTGGTLLFSPACSSFDQFESYMERGDVFNKLVQEYEYMVNGKISE